MKIWGDRGKHELWLPLSPSLSHCELIEYFLVSLEWGVFLFIVWMSLCCWPCTAYVCVHSWTRQSTSLRFYTQIRFIIFTYPTHEFASWWEGQFENNFLRFRICGSMSAQIWIFLKLHFPFFGLGKINMHSLQTKTQIKMLFCHNVLVRGNLYTIL